MGETKYVIGRHIRADSKPGKYHLLEASSKVSLCSVKFRWPSSASFAKPIEVALNNLIERVKRYRNSHRQACKTCVKRAQKLRNPLDRLAEIPDSSNSAELTLFR